MLCVCGEGAITQVIIHKQASSVSNDFILLASKDIPHVCWLVGDIAKEYRKSLSDRLIITLYSSLQ